MSGQEHTIQNVGTTVKCTRNTIVSRLCITPDPIFRWDESLVEWCENSTTRCYDGVTIETFPKLRRNFVIEKILYINMDGYEYQIPVYENFSSFINRRFQPFLNGNNGEATNGDDMSEVKKSYKNALINKNALNKRNHKESVTTRFASNQANGHAKQTPGNKLIEFQNLCKAYEVLRAELHVSGIQTNSELEYMMIRLEAMRLEYTAEPAVPKVQETYEKFLLKMAVDLPPISTQQDIPVERVESIVLKNIRIFVKDPDFENGIINNPVTDLKIIAGGVVAVSLFTIFHVPAIFATVACTVAGVGTSELSTRTSRLLRTCLHDIASQNVNQNLGSGAPLDIDNEFTTYREFTSHRHHNDFWASRGYTHYIDVSIPTMFLEFSPGSAAQVVSCFLNESGLIGIAKGTFGRDEKLLERFNKCVEREGGWAIPNLEPLSYKTYQYYVNAASLYLAQTQYHSIYQSRLVSGVTAGLPQYTGSAINF